MNTENVKTSTRGNIVLKWGIIGGLVSIIQTMISYYIHDSHLEKTGDLPNLLISILIVVIITFMAMKELRESSGGYISFGRAYGTGLLTSLIMVALTCIFLFVMVNYIVGFETYVSATIDETMTQMKKWGSSEKDIERRVNGMKDMTPASHMLWTFGFGYISHFILDLISAAIARKNPPQN
jgi:uncharacterized membrane protein